MHRADGACGIDARHARAGHAVRASPGHAVRVGKPRRVRSSCGTGAATLRDGTSGGVPLDVREQPLGGFGGSRGRTQFPHRPGLDQRLPQRAVRQREHGSSSKRVSTNSRRASWRWRPTPQGVQRLRPLPSAKPIAAGEFERAPSGILFAMDETDDDYRIIGWEAAACGPRRALLGALSARLRAIACTSGWSARGRAARLREPRLRQLRGSPLRKRTAARRPLASGREFRGANASPTALEHDARAAAAASCLPEAGF
jgi:hypothetical protein